MLLTPPSAAQVAPQITSAVVLESLGLHSTLFEEIVLNTYVAAFEIASHAGKHVPIMSVVPPLAPLYNSLFEVDRDNTLFVSHRLGRQKAAAVGDVYLWLTRRQCSPPPPFPLARQTPRAQDVQLRHQPMD